MHGFAAAQGKHHEWPTAENSAAYLLPRLQALREQNPEIHLLDIGAGPGTLTAFLAKCIPEGQVTATDISSEILVSAEEHAQSIGIQNITFTQANVYNVSRQLGKATFDVTHAHQVLCHLFDPILAIREMLRVTKPGGVVALRDVDMRTWCFWPELPDLLRFQKVMMVTMDRTGGGRMAGRQLVSWALRAGANRENITATYGTCCYSSPAERQLWGTSLRARSFIIS